jgi:hypothetical protein
MGKDILSCLIYHVFDGLNLNVPAEKEEKQVFQSQSVSEG